MIELPEKPATNVQRKSQATATMKMGYPPYMSDKRANIKIVLHDTKERTEAGQKLAAVPLPANCFSIVGSSTEKPEMRYSCNRVSVWIHLVGFPLFFPQSSAGRETPLLTPRSCVRAMDRQNPISPAVDWNPF